jgi:hypothetical protein
METECGRLLPPIAQFLYYRFESFEAVPPRRVASKRFVEGQVTGR